MANRELAGAGGATYVVNINGAVYGSERDQFEKIVVGALNRAVRKNRA